MSVAFFDLDRTLLDCNSGRLWLSFEWKNGRLRSKEVAIGAWWLLKYSLGHHDLTDAYASAVRKLAGEPEELIAHRTQEWFDKYVAHRLRPGGAEALSHHRAQGDRLVLATSSSPYAAMCAVQRFGLDERISTEFEVDSGVFTGEVSSWALGDEKAERAKEWAKRHGCDLQECSFYTDSMTDRALLELVGRPVVVNPDRPLARLAEQRGWPVRDWGRSANIIPDVRR